VSPTAVRTGITGRDGAHLAERVSARARVRRCRNVPQDEQRAHLAFGDARDQAARETRMHGHGGPVQSDSCVTDVSPERGL
jgi:GDP-D-mannose dehydratase